MLSKNPNYLSSELEVGLRTRVIPRDKLSLRKEVGEGAFGKVYRGEYTAGVASRRARDLATGAKRRDGHF